MPSDIYQDIGVYGVIMKNKSILIRLSDEELDLLNKTYKKELIDNDLITRSEFVRRMLALGIKNYKIKSEKK